MKHIPVLVILFPLCGALLCPLLDKLARNVGKRAAIFALLLSAICAATQLAQVARSGAAITGFSSVPAAAAICACRAARAAFRSPAPAAGTGSTGRADGKTPQSA